MVRARGQRYDPFGSRFPTMSRAHFELIAYVLNRHGDDGRDALMVHFANELAETNCRFDRAKFYERVQS